MQTIICMKWGTRYPVDYVNRLWSMIQRQTSRPTRLVCYTDDPVGLDAGIVAYGLPPYAAPADMMWDGWRKISLWSPTLEGVSGDCLFLDLDIVITGDLDALFDYEPHATYCVIENWTQKGEGIGNTSAFRFRVGAHPEIFELMQRDPRRQKEAYRIEQTYISRTIDEQTFFPDEWCVSFKHSLLPAWPLNFVMPPRLASSARIVAFTGKPDPHEARDGIWEAPLHKKLYKHVRPTAWIAEHWR
jgi:hypothetical protein